MLLVTWVGAGALRAVLFLLVDVLAFERQLLISVCFRQPKIFDVALCARVTIKQISPNHLPPRDHNRVPWCRWTKRHPKMGKWGDVGSESSTCANINNNVQSPVQICSTRIWKENTVFLFGSANNPHFLRFTPFRYHFCVKFRTANVYTILLEWFSAMKSRQQNPKWQNNTID